MRKIYVLMGCLLIVMLINACQKRDDHNEIVLETSTTSETQEVTNEENVETTQSPETTLAQENTNTPLDMSTFAIEVDPSLKGIALIKAAKIVRPIDALTYDTLGIYGTGDERNQTSGSITKVGKSYKRITGLGGDAEGVMVTMYNANENMTYQYFEATQTGYKYSEDLSFGTGPSVEGEYDLTTLYAEESNLIKAEVVEFEGEPVMYFEILEAGNKVTAWVSLRYGITIQTEVYEGEQIVSSMNISNIQVPKDLGSDFFLPPLEVVFEDYSQLESAEEITETATEMTPVDTSEVTTQAPTELETTHSN